MNAEAILSTIVTGGVLVVLAAMVFESWTLWTHRRPITLYVRPLAARYPAVTAALAVVVGLLLGHLLWP